MLHFRKITEVSSPIEEVATLHRNPEILKELTPPWAPVNFHRIDPQAEGSVVEMTLWLGMIPVFWRAKHLDVHPITGFSDIQEIGPFQRWKHQHNFQKLDDEKTLIEDQIEAEFKTGWRGILGRLIWLGLPSLFVYRHWKTKKLLLQSSKKMASISQYMTG